MGKPIRRIALPNDLAESPIFSAFIVTPLITKAIKTPANILVFFLEYKNTPEIIVDSHIIELRTDRKM